MAKKEFVIPKEGTKVSHPQRNRLIHPDGEHVVLDSFINRRIADGDLIVSKPQKAKSTRKGDK